MNLFNNNLFKYLEKNNPSKILSQLNQKTIINYCQNALEVQMYASDSYISSNEGPLKLNELDLPSISTPNDIPNVSTKTLSNNNKDLFNILCTLNKESISLPETLKGIKEKMKQSLKEKEKPQPIKTKYHGVYQQENVFIAYFEKSSGQKTEKLGEYKTAIEAAKAYDSHLIKKDLHIKRKSKDDNRFALNFPSRSRSRSTSRPKIKSKTRSKSKSRSLSNDRKYIRKLTSKKTYDSERGSDNYSKNRDSSYKEFNKYYNSKKDVEKKKDSPSRKQNDTVPVKKEPISSNINKVITYDNNFSQYNTKNNNEINPTLTTPQQPNIQSKNLSNPKDPLGTNSALSLMNKRKNTSPLYSNNIYGNYQYNYNNYPNKPSNYYMNENNNSYGYGQNYYPNNNNYFQNYQQNSLNHNFYNQYQNYMQPSQTNLMNNSYNSSAPYNNQNNNMNIPKSSELTNSNFKNSYLQSYTANSYPNLPYNYDMKNNYPPIPNSGNNALLGNLEEDGGKSSNKIEKKKEDIIKKNNEFEENKTDISNIIGKAEIGNKINY